MRREVLASFPNGLGQRHLTSLRSSKAPEFPTHFRGGAPKIATTLGSSWVLHSSLFSDTDRSSYGEVRDVTPRKTRIVRRSSFFMPRRGTLYAKDRTRIWSKKIHNLFLSSPTRGSSRVNRIYSYSGSAAYLPRLVLPSTSTYSSLSGEVSTARDYMVDLYRQSIRRTFWTQSFNRQSRAGALRTLLDSRVMLRGSTLPYLVRRRTRASSTRGLYSTGAYLSYSLTNPSTSYTSPDPSLRRYYYYRPRLHRDTYRRLLQRSAVSLSSLDSALLYLKRLYVGRKVRPVTHLRSALGRRSISLFRRSLSQGFLQRWISRFGSVLPPYFYLKGTGSVIRGELNRSILRFNGTTRLRGPLRSQLCPPLANKETFEPTASKYFVRNAFFAPHFQVFLFETSSRLPLRRERPRHSDPYDFVNHVQMKKSVFRRLLSQKYRADRYFRIKKGSKIFNSNSYTQSYVLPNTLGSDQTSWGGKFLKDPKFYLLGRRFSQYSQYSFSDRRTRQPYFRKTRYRPGYQRM
jgi:hypothetical protein